jgi:hypothetical protein
MQPHSLSAAVAQLVLVRSMRAPVLLALLLTSAQSSFATDFGVYYPHTRWIATGRHAIKLDAFTDRLIIASRGKPAIIVHGCWRGRSFLRDCESDYFAIAHEGVDGWIEGDRRFEDIHFRRVRPDPNT